MRKAFIAIMILTMLFALGGCAAKAATVETATTENLDEIIGVPEIINVPVLKDPTQGLPVEPNDDKGPGANTNALNRDENIALGRAAAEAYGFNMDDAPTWEEVKDARAADYVGCAKCFWVKDGLLHTEVNGEAADLTPDEAVERYKDNPDFMREYIYLMQYRDDPDPATYIDENGEVRSFAYDPPGEPWDGPSD